MAQKSAYLVEDKVCYNPIKLRKMPEEKFKATSSMKTSQIRANVPTQK